jgi:hypothetical protein
LLDILSAVARKFPAAPFTRISILPYLSKVYLTTYLHDSIFDTSPGKDIA